MFFYSADMPGHGAKGGTWNLEVAHQICACQWPSVGQGCQGSQGVSWLSEISLVKCHLVRKPLGVNWLMHAWPSHRSRPLMSQIRHPLHVWIGRWLGAGCFDRISGMRVGNNRCRHWVYPWQTSIPESSWLELSRPSLTVTPPARMQWPQWKGVTQSFLEL